MRIYVSKDNRIRIGSGIWVEAKRWGKKNEINIPNIPGEEREMLLEKRAKLKALTEHIEKEVQTAEDKSIIDKSYLEKIVRKFHKPRKKVRFRFSILWRGTLPRINYPNRAARISK